jgi:regulator of protease activity HflC (stomatin/prohibitin superfamily)
VIQDITILDIRLTKSYLSSKEELLRAENGLKLAEAKLEAQKKESEKRVLEAKSQKEVKIIEAEALAEYNKIINSQSITD